MIPPSAAAAREPAPTSEAASPLAATGGLGLEVRDLRKAFGPVVAVSDVSFDLPPGGFLAVFGPNGAGKSTLLRILAGLTRADEGEIRLGGAPRPRDDRSWRGRVGVLSHRTFLHDHLTAVENLEFYGALHGLPAGRDRYLEAVEAVGLAERADDRVEGFSRGMRQRLALARTLLHEPELVLLDEPFSGLDVHGGLLLTGVLERLRDGSRSVILVTHDLTRGLTIADRWAIQVRGRFLREGVTAGLDRLELERLYHETVEGRG